MIFRLISLRLFSYFFIIVIFSTVVFAYDLEIDAGDVASINGNDSLVIPVVMKTYSDSVVGYRITIESDHPGMLQFVGFDTSGTLSAGWEVIATTILGDTFQIEALANNASLPTVPGIDFPQDGSVPLLKLRTTLDSLHDTASINQVQLDFIVDLYNFSFAGEGGYTIGLSYYEPTIDTCWCDCSSWFYLTSGDSICLVWVDVPIEEADTMIVDTVLNPYLDFDKVNVDGGTVFIQTLPDSCTLGDVDCTNVRNILDITYLINYLYRQGPAPCFGASYGDVNCNCSTNLLDVICLINFLYRDGACTPCSCQEWEGNCGEKR